MKKFTSYFFLTVVASALLVVAAFAQTPIIVQKTSGTNAITANLNIGAGKTLTVDSGGTFVLNGSFSPGAGTIAWSALTGVPTTIAGYGITDGVSTGGSYTDPSWITSLAATKLSGTLSAARLPAFSGDLTTPSGSSVTTLATVNANTGSFGDSTHVATFTVNAKGLITTAGTTLLQVSSTGISDSTAVGRSLITAANAGAARSVLGLATVAATGSYTDLSNQPTFNTLSPMTTVGDTIYGGASGAGTRLPGNITSTREFLRQTGTGSASLAPAWDTLVNADVPTALTGKTYNGITVTGVSTPSLQVSGTSSISGTNTGDQTITLTGDVTGSGTGSFATTLATVNTNVGSFGSGTLVPTFTVNAKGQITAAGSATSTPVFANITSKPTTAAGYGIVNGGVIDTWGTKTAPSGTVVGTTDAQALTNKTYEGHTWTAGAGSLTQGGNVTFAGVFTTTLTVGANSSVTLPVSGTLATVAGAETLSNKTITSSTINSTPIGGTTPAAGAFTVVDSGSDGTGTNVGAVVAHGGSGSGGGGYFQATRNAANPVYFGNLSAVAGGSTDDAVVYAGAGQTVQIWANGALKGNFTSTGLQGAIGATTPAAGFFSQLGVNGNVNVGSGGTGSLINSVAFNGGSGTGGGSVQYFLRNSVAVAEFGNESSIFATNPDNLAVYTPTGANFNLFMGGTSVTTSFTSTGINQTGIGQTNPGPGKFTTLQTATHTPSSASDTGVAGTITWDASFIYICTATNTWTRVAIATW